MGSWLSSRSLEQFDREQADVSCHSGLPFVCLGGFEECQRDRSEADPGCRDTHRSEQVCTFRGCSRCFLGIIQCYNDCIGI